MHTVAFRRTQSSGARMFSGLLAMVLVTAFSVPTVFAEDLDDQSYEYSEEEGPLKECLDAASAGYNSCLQGAGTAWERLLCDLEWEAEVVLCVAKYVGKVRVAANGGEEEPAY